MDQQVYAATAPIPEDAIADSPGAFARATVNQGDQIELLMVAFLRETATRQPVAAVDHLVAGHLDRGELFVWRVDERVVSFAVLGGYTERGLRIDVLYTRPRDRQRGYALSLVRAVTNHVLSDGREYCVVYADRRSPSANAVYRRLGFAAAFESRLYDLTGAAPHPGTGG